MNNLYTDIGYKSLNKFGEQLCGDHVEVVDQGEGSTVVVLADGMGSGVKANILSTLTSKIISTMMANSMSLEECVETISQTLPVCSVRGVAYSTFTIIRIIENEQAEIIQYDNPHVIMLRDGKSLDIPQTVLKIDNKTIYKSHVFIKENDTFIAISDGAIHAGVGKTLNFGWQRNEIVKFIEPVSRGDFTAKALTSLLLDKCDYLYGGQPGDDTTICTIKIRCREPVNLIIGPPSNPEDVPKMMSLFFGQEGKHIVCGGTTSMLAAQFLGKKVFTSLEYQDPEIPPIAKIDGVDLVTEGVITFSKVLSYANDYLDKALFYSHWSTKGDGASLICRLLFEDATDINFYVGRAVNPAHQNPSLPINFNIKMRLVDELAACLKRMGKRIKVSYF